MSNQPPRPPATPGVTPEGLEHLEKVIYERTLDVFGSFCRETWRARTARLAETSPATLATEIAGAISEGVVRHLATDPTWPTSPSRPARADEVVLSAVDVDRWGGALWPQPAAAIRRLDYEATKTPAWPFEWVLRRLTALKVLVKSHGHRQTPVAADGLISVTLRRDGSATALFIDGTAREVGPADPDGQLVENEIRRGAVDSHEGHYMTVDELAARLAERGNDGDNSEDSQ